MRLLFFGNLFFPQTSVRSACSAGGIEVAVQSVIVMSTVTIGIDVVPMVHWHHLRRPCCQEGISERSEAVSVPFCAWAMPGHWLVRSLGFSRLGGKRKCCVCV